MRNNLHRLSQIIAPSFFIYYILINTPCCNIIGASRRSIGESLVVTQVKVGFVSIDRHITFSMFIRVQCSGIYIDVRIELLDSYSITSCQKQSSQRSRNNTFSTIKYGLCVTFTRRKIRKNNPQSIATFNRIITFHLLRREKPITDRNTLQFLPKRKTIGKQFVSNNHYLCKQMRK